MDIFSINGLTRWFDGVAAVDGISLSFPRGEIIGIIGPNGSGKSTLIHLITGVIRFNSGTIMVRGTMKKKMVRSSVAELGITRTFQEVRVFQQMTVWENVMVVLSKRNVWLSLFGKDDEESERRARESLERVGLWEKRKHLVGGLSYGQRKLLEIARVICMDAEIIFFDEPFAGLFRRMVEKVSELLQEFRKEGKTVVLVEHNMEIIRRLADHVVVLDGGTLLAEGKPGEVLRDRKVREAYFGK